MPVYDYLCGDCGHFTDMRPMAESASPQACPDCGGEAPRAFINVPNYACMATDQRKAHATNERSANAPQTLAAMKAQHGAGCGCCGGSKKLGRAVQKTASGAKGFPTSRPWMISH